MTLLAIKRRVRRWLKVLGLLLLWRGLGWVLVILVFGLMALGALKSISVAWPDFPSIVPTRQKNIQHLDTFLQGLPYLSPVWSFIPPLDLRSPLTLLTDGWVVLLPLLGLSKHLLYRKVKEEIMPSSIIVHGSIGVVNTGKMGIRQVESIAAHLTRISSPTEDQVAHAIAALTKAVSEDPNLNDSKRIELLDQFVELARQTALPPADRSKGVSRAIIGALDRSLNTAGNLADVWSAWGETIKSFFGI